MRTKFVMPIHSESLYLWKRSRSNRNGQTNESQTMTRREVRQGRDGRRECTVKGGR